MRGYAAALAFTLAVEVPLALLWLGRLGLATGRALRSATVVNLVSHPVAFLVAWQLVTRVVPGAVALVVIEFGVIVGEAAGYRRLAGVDGESALQLAAVANAASLGIGWVLLR